MGAVSLEDHGAVVLPLEVVGAVGGRGAGAVGGEALTHLCPEVRGLHLAVLGGGDLAYRVPAQPRGASKALDLASCKGRKPVTESIETQVGSQCNEPRTRVHSCERSRKEPKTMSQSLDHLPLPLDCAIIWRQRGTGE
jgi:hypothetical protein